MLLAEKKMEEIEGTMKGWDMLEPFQERAMLNAILWGFHQGRNYTTGIWDVWNPSNKKVAAATTQPAQKQDKTWKKQSEPNASCWKEDGRNRGNNERLGTLPRKSQVECYSVGSPQGRNYSRGIGDVRNSSKKTGSIHKPSPKIGQNMTKHMTTKRFLPFLTPSHARP